MILSCMAANPRSVRILSEVIIFHTIPVDLCFCHGCCFMFSARTCLEPAILRPWRMMRQSVPYLSNFPLSLEHHVLPQGLVHHSLIVRYLADL